MNKLLISSLNYHSIQIGKIDRKYLHRLFLVEPTPLN